MYGLLELRRKNRLKKEDLIDQYNNVDILGKWQLIKAAVEENITELYPYDSCEYLRFSKERKEEAVKNKRYFKLIWHYWLRRVPLIAPALGRKYLSFKNKGYYQYKTWYYEYLEPVVDIRDNVANYEKVFELLVDEKSKEIFCNILMARITMDEEYYLAAYEKSKEYQQYFALDILPQPELNGVFVDCGGYTGDTAEKYIKYYSKDYKSIYVYEPDTQNAMCAKENLRKYHNINIRQCGVGKENGIAYFNSMGTSSSSIQKKGTEVKVVSLDKDVSERITFIKMDIEGEESNAIIGTENHIRYEKPICAICLYHKIQDIWKLPLQMLKINPNYKLYLRHYRENAMEIVAYFV